MSTIPASQIVNVIPNVLSAGGNALDIIAVMLTENDQVPIGVVQPFATAADVSSYFGPASDEYALAVIYFNGFDNSNVKPSKLYIAQYPTAAVGAYLRGGDLSGLSLTELQAFGTGTLTISINGVSAVAASVNLSAVSSFSNAAAVIQAGFNAVDASGDSCTIAGTTLTVSGTLTGAFAPGQTITGSSVTAGSHIISQTSGTTGGAGDYLLSASSTVAVGEAITGTFVPTVTYDSVSGGFNFATLLTGVGETISFATTNAFATSLKLTEAAGAVTSQGAAIAVPGTFMDGVVAVTTDWATFFTAFDPDVSGNANKLLFAVWANSQASRYGYICWDTDSSPSVTVPSTGSLGYLLGQNEYTGTCLIGNDADDTVSSSHAAFVAGSAASIDFSETNGRITFAFRYQSGLAVTATNASSAANLISNGYNFIGAYATANDQFNFMYPGSVSGLFLWFDSFINQIWLNNQFQLALMVLLTNVKSIPYNQAGYALIEAACLDVINQGLNFGAFRAGVTLSQAQAAEVDSAAGVKISTILNQRGWYLQVLDASPQVRAARGSPPCTFWYMDGQSVQKITLTSVNVQ